MCSCEVGCCHVATCAEFNEGKFQFLHYSIGNRCYSMRQFEVHTVHSLQYAWFETMDATWQNYNRNWSIGLVHCPKIKRENLRANLYTF